MSITEPKYHKSFNARLIFQRNKLTLVIKFSKAVFINEFTIVMSTISYK